MSKRKSWSEKLRDSKGLPRVEKITGKMSKRWGTGTVAIPAPMEVDETMRRVPEGKLITINEIRKALAKKHGATIGCPITAGIFAWIAANAAEEQRQKGERGTTPYWREVSEFISTKLFHNTINKKPLLARLGLVIVVIQLLLPIYTPFFYYTFSSDLEYLNGQYNLFSVTTQDDVELMQWMTDGIPDDARVLISPFESGSFIPLLSDVKAIVYPFTASRHSESYQTLTSLICQQTLNATTYQLIEEFEIDYIFVGSRALSGQPKWHATLFLGNPNFETIKKIGNSYLFRILSTDPTLVFRDDFEYENLTEGNWIYCVAGESIGNGSGQAVTSSQYAKHGTSSLMMTAEKTKGWYYANWIYRKLWLPRTANTTLSFYIDANCSLYYDFMAIIISDELWENKVYFATPNDHPSEYMVKLPAPQGFFTLNLSQIWNEKFNSTLPNLIYLEIQIADFDGVRDVGFLDCIEIRA